ncbi:MAG: ABC transporter substrate-binding protein, partial [Gorillibacterium sp.]|nr:ABC transporter substrate-binding protein [Gorillibacterium sp.]
ESGHLPYTVFMAKKSFLDKNAAQVQKFTNAIHKAQKWVETKPVDEIVEAIVEYFPNVDKEILGNSIKRYKEQGSFAADPIIDEQEWNNLQDVMEAAGELKQRADYTKLVDNHFAEKAKETVK